VEQVDARAESLGVLARHPRRLVGEVREIRCEQNFVNAHRRLLAA
jgi:hypothetical protein